jgi:hypothetical protein
MSFLTFDVVDDYNMGCKHPTADTKAPHCVPGMMVNNQTINVSTCVDVTITPMIILAG